MLQSFHVLYIINNICNDRTLHRACSEPGKTRYCRCERPEEDEAQEDETEMKIEVISGGAHDNGPVFKDVDILQGEKKKKK